VNVLVYLLLLFILREATVRPEGAIDENVLQEVSVLLIFDFLEHACAVDLPFKFAYL